MKQQIKLHKDKRFKVALQPWGTRTYLFSADKVYTAKVQGNGWEVKGGSFYFHINRNEAEVVN